MDRSRRRTTHHSTENSEAREGIRTNTNLLGQDRKYRDEDWEILQRKKIRTEEKQIEEEEEKKKQEQASMPHNMAIEELRKELAQTISWLTQHEGNRRTTDPSGLASHEIQYWECTKSLPPINKCK
jgi:hypothetical protein